MSSSTPKACSRSLDNLQMLWLRSELWGGRPAKQPSKQPPLSRPHGDFLLSNVMATAEHVPDPPRTREPRFPVQPRASLPLLFPVPNPADRCGPRPGARVLVLQPPSQISPDWPPSFTSTVTILGQWFPTSHFAPQGTLEMLLAVTTVKGLLPASAGSRGQGSC